MKQLLLTLLVAVLLFGLSFAGIAMGVIVRSLRRRRRCAGLCGDSPWDEGRLHVCSCGRKQESRDSEDDSPPGRGEGA
jgi:hypothetical protein